MQTLRCTPCPMPAHLPCPPVHPATPQPILLAPVIPLQALALRKHPRLRVGVVGATGAAVLIYAHVHAIGSSAAV